MTQRRGLQLDRVVLLGRTFDEYAAFFGFRPEDLAGRIVLDAAAGVSSFAAEARQRGYDVIPCDPIYGWDAGSIESRCESDLQEVAATIGDLPVYNWERSYGSPAKMRALRERACKTFLTEFRTYFTTRYVAGILPCLPFSDRSFDLTLCSYFLFVYQDQFPYEFHRDAIRELMRVTRGEARIYPMITFEGERSAHVDRIKTDPAFPDLRFEEVPTQFEFLVGSNAYLRITHA